MTHLTTKQILQFTDGTLDYALQAQCTKHLAICERCRKEVELQKAISKTASHQPLVRIDPGFVQRVMARIVPQPRKSWRTRIVDNLGNVVAMALVLTMLGYAISNPSLFKVQQQSSTQSIIPQSVSEAYAKFIQIVGQRANEATQRIAIPTSHENNNVISLTVLSLVILGALDQFVLKRYMGMRTKH